MSHSTCGQFPHIRGAGEPGQRPVTLGAGARMCRVAADKAERTALGNTPSQVVHQKQTRMCVRVIHKARHPGSRDGTG